MSNQKLISEMKKWRHHLHTHPETAFEEKETSDYVASMLEEMKIEVHRNIGGTGLVGNLKCGNGGGIIGLRADMDAINLSEEGSLSYKSQNDNKMHACGHDGHVATLLGAAKILSEGKDFDGTVRFIFQPAEEPGKGALAMIEDGLLKRFPMDEIYGLHNQPNIPIGSVWTRVGGVMASEDNFIIKIKGKGSHASSPDLAIDPLIIASEIILALQTIVSRNIRPTIPAVISCTEIHTDGAHNAIPSNVVITGDTRSNSIEIQTILEKRMKEIVHGICTMHGADYEFTYTHEFAPTINWEECVKTVVESANKVSGVDNVDGNCEIWMGSEDFGYYLDKIPGCFIFLGIGSNDIEIDDIPLHNAKYDYNDDALEIGANLFKEIVLLKLPK